MLLVTCFSISLNISSARAASINLSKAVIVTSSTDKVQINAAKMLRDEVEKRTRIALEIVPKIPAGNKIAIVIGTAKDMPGKFSPPSGLKVPDKAEGYAIWVDSNKTVCLVGRDRRGALYATGKLLRTLNMRRDRVNLDSDVKISTAPVTEIRGHQIGYRPKTNAYDAWSIDIWEQYYRDMVAYGTNAVEFVPPESDDSDDSPHFPKPKLEMMTAMSQLADDYDLDVWIWYPVVDDDDLNERAIKKALKVREEVFKKLPRIDAIFIPGGDPGEVYPTQLFDLMKNLKVVLNKHHPKAQMWVSPQGFDFHGDAPGYLKVFYEEIAKKPDWLDGVVFGPQVADNLKVLREKLPKQYKIRRYPDITHCLDAQYQVPDWDSAFHLTLYREPINPRPYAYAKIFRDWAKYTDGYITYSEGVNDDLNKFVWSCLGWDPDTNVEYILVDYSNYFISNKFADSFAQGLIGLEKNWQGPLIANYGVHDTLRIFREMELDATPQDKQNWRFQLALYRAYYDAYIRRRLIYETELEEQAMEVLRMATEKKVDTLLALDKAEEILNKAQLEKVGLDLRARVYEMAEALFQSIRMQVSVERYEARSERRGGNLGLIDTSLNNSIKLRKTFANIRAMSGKRRRSAIEKLTLQGYKMKIDRDKEVIDWGVN
jgi:hypothetical protein